MNNKRKLQQVLRTVLSGEKDKSSALNVRIVGGQYGKKMTLQEFLDEQEATVKDLIQSVMEEQKNVQYCCYCVERRGDKIGCCGENHWIQFRDLDDDTQLEIVKEILENE